MSRTKIIKLNIIENHHRHIWPTFKTTVRFVPAGSFDSSLVGTCVRVIV